MAKKALKNKQERQAKFKVREYTRWMFWTAK